MSSIQRSKQNICTVAGVIINWTKPPGPEEYSAPQEPCGAHSSSHSPPLGDGHHPVFCCSIQCICSLCTSQQAPVFEVHIIGITVYIFFVTCFFLTVVLRLAMFSSLWIQEYAIFTKIIGLDVILTSFVWPPSSATYLQTMWPLFSSFVKHETDYTTGHEHLKNKKCTSVVFLFSTAQCLLADGSWVSKGVGGHLAGSVGRPRDS